MRTHPDRPLTELRKLKCHSFIMSWPAMATPPIVFVHGFACLRPLRLGRPDRASLVTPSRPSRRSICAATETARETRRIARSNVTAPRSPRLQCALLLCLRPCIGRPQHGLPRCDRRRPCRLTAANRRRDPGGWQPVLRRHGTGAAGTASPLRTVTLRWRKHCSTSSCSRRKAIQQWRPR